MKMEEWTDMGKPPVRKKAAKKALKRPRSVAPSFLAAPAAAADSGGWNPPVPIAYNSPVPIGNPPVPLELQIQTEAKPLKRGG
jgi:hypothetical protein